MTNQPGSDLREWNATSYHLVANPHVDWGKAVLERLPLRGDETVIDAGCGTGRLTELLLDRLPEGKVIAIDQSANMLARAAEHLRPLYGDRVTFEQHDLADLPHVDDADAIFSTATFHWIPDHARLFATLCRALRPGGWLVAQCGGANNIRTINERALAILHAPPFAEHAGDWTGPWRFADAPETEDLLTKAGFTDVAANVIDAPVTFDDPATYREFLETVVLGTHLTRLPTEALRQHFLDLMVTGGATDTPPWSLGYTRLNLQGRRPAPSPSAQ
jgi:trans-aconitate 2-methyltransferase